MYFFNFIYFFKIAFLLLVYHVNNSDNDSDNDIHRRIRPYKDHIANYLIEISIFI